MSASPSNGNARKELASPPFMAVSPSEWESLPMSSHADARYDHILRKLAGPVSNKGSPRSRNTSPRGAVGVSRQGSTGLERADSVPSGERRNSNASGSADAINRLLETLAERDSVSFAETPLGSPRQNLSASQVRLGTKSAIDASNPELDSASMFNIGTPALSANPSLIMPVSEPISLGGAHDDDDIAQIVSVAPSPSKGDPQAPVSHVLKLIMLGDASVGKTALIQRFVNGTYQVLPYKPTVGADFYSQKLEYTDKSSGEKSLITLQIWDTAGQERYKSLASSFYRGADVCVLVEDASRPSVMGSIEEWHQDFLKHASPMDHESFPFVFVLNKADLLSNRSQAEAEWKKRICERFHVSEHQAIAASAKSGLAVEKVFFKAAQMGVKRAVSSASKIKQQQRGLPSENQHLINLSASPRDDEANNGCLIMENEPVLINVIPFLTCVEGFRIFSILCVFSRDVWHKKIQTNLSFHSSYLNLDDIKAKLSNNLPGVTEEVFRALLKTPSSSLKATATNGDELMHIFARKGHASIIQLLIQFKADVNSIGSGRMTPLHCAAFAKSEYACKTLLSARADPCLKDSLRRLPEDWARLQSIPELNDLLRNARLDRSETSESSCLGCL